MSIFQKSVEKSHVSTWFLFDRTSSIM